MSHHEILSVGILREVERVEIITRRIGKSQGALVGTVDIAVIGTICKIVGTLEIGIYVRLEMIVALADAAIFLASQGWTDADSSTKSMMMMPSS